MKRKERKLTRLILGALMATSGALIAPGVASADDPVNGGCTATGTTTSYYFTQDNTTLTISDGAIVPNVDLKGHKGCKIVMLGSGQVSTKIMSTVAGAEVTVEGGTVNSLFGAYMTGDGVEASGNKVIVKNSTITNLTGGYSGGANADANNNEVTVESGTIGDSGIRGGNSQNKDAKLNTVTINGATTTINGHVIGGDANYGDAVDNKVYFNDGTISSGKNIYGGCATNGGNVTDNKVYIAGGTVGGAVYGGRSTDGGNASGNIVTISGGTITGNVLGSLAQQNVETNKVNISNGTVTGSVWGARSSLNGNATGNEVNISGGTFQLNVIGGGGIEASKNNKVNITGGTFEHYDPSNPSANYGTIRGGYSQGGGDATENEVNISGSNTIFKRDRTHEDGGYNVYGGYTQGSGNANNNTVTISGGQFTNTYVYGGFTYAGGNAENNTVNVLASVTLRGIYGGWNNNGGSSSGNTLNVAAKGVTVEKNIGGFQNLNFFLPTDMTTSDTMLTVNGTATVTDAKVGVMAQGKLANLTKNDKVTLLHAETLNGTVSQTTEKIVKPTSLTTVDTYEFSVTSDANNIYATITKDDSGSGGGDDPSNPTNPTEDNLKSPVETRAATVTMLNAGADMLASQGFVQAANAVAIEAAEQVKNGAADAKFAGGFTPFAAFGGSSMRAESGSHVDTKGFGINVGFAREIPNSQGKLLFGPVVEYGGGKYDSYNNDVHGDGGAHYWGIGVMARQVNHDGFYYEGSVRGGRVTSDYSANLPKDIHASYDSSSNYWAAHLGVGKVFAAGEKGTVDGYLKYFYSHQSGDDTDINLRGNGGTMSERASFDSVDSNRIRIGARYTHKINEMNSLYGGLAYQYEFGGEARAHYSTSGVAPSPSVKGSSGMLELGWQVKPGGPLTLDLGVTGWAGKQRGGSVQLGATWTF